MTLTRQRATEVRAKLGYINALVDQGQSLSTACAKARVSVAEFWAVGRRSGRG